MPSKKEYTIDEIRKHVVALTPIEPGSYFSFEIRPAGSFHIEKRLVDIYNLNEEFNKGKRESFACRPCVVKVVQFFKGFIEGYDFAMKQLTKPQLQEETEND